MWHGVPFARQRRPVIGVLRMCWLLPLFKATKAELHRRPECDLVHIGIFWNDHNFGATFGITVIISAIPCIKA